MSEKFKSPGSRRVFSTTHWSVVLAAGNSQDSQGRQAMASLCESYWYPIYSQLRRQGASADQSRDLTQGFFAHLIEKRTLKIADPARGRFRGFLKKSLEHFLANERKRDTAAKRGGGRAQPSLDVTNAEAVYRLESRRGESPEVAFERQWARTVVARAMDRVRDSQDDSARAARFDQLRPYLVDGSTIPYRVLAERLDMSVSALKVTIHRLRKRLGEAIRAEIALTVEDSSEIEPEIRYLISSLQSRM